jgi:hypothetical protein
MCRCEVGHDAERGCGDDCMNHGGYWTTFMILAWEASDIVHVHWRGRTICGTRAPSDVVHAERGARTDSCKLARRSQQQ